MGQGEGDAGPLATPAEEFARALRPRRLGPLAKDPQRLQARMAAYACRHDWPAGRLVRHALRIMWADVNVSRKDVSRRELARIFILVLRRKFLAPPDEDEPLPRLPTLPRLRTCDDLLLAEMGRHVVDWGLLNEQLASPADRTPELDATLAKLVRGLAGSVRRHWPAAAAEDAAAGAFRHALATAGNPLAGYVFEQDFFSWLVGQARGHIEWPDAHPPAPPAGPGGGVANPAAGMDEEIEALHRWRERFRLAAESFEGGDTVTRRALSVVWRAVAAGVEDLASAAREAAVNPDTLYVIQRRLRRRLYALRFVLDFPRPEQDDPGDVKMLAYVESETSRGGASHREADTAPLRWLGALARATRACGHDHLAWSLAACLVIDKGEPHASVRTALEDSRRLRVRTPDAERRLRHVHTWAEPDPGEKRRPVRERVTRLVQSARHEGLAFLASAVWQLKILEDVSGERIAAVLAPGSPEADAAVRRLAAML